MCKAVGREWTTAGYVFAILTGTRRALDTALDDAARPAPPHVRNSDARSV
ncbi:hypothetical protein [Streptomyces sp. TLI_105]|nr:hypothetical protein [Streptomyces sp. TLI_105]